MQTFDKTNCIAQRRTCCTRSMSSESENSSEILFVLLSSYSSAACFVRPVTVWIWRRRKSRNARPALSIAASEALCPALKRRTIDE